MDSSFSWGDTLRAAVRSCLAPCFPGSSDSDSEAERYENPHQALTQNEDLERLLHPSTSDSETDALSLHSNIASRPRRRRQRRRKGKSRTITLFGYNLFGRPTQPIQLPDDDDALLRSSQITTNRSISTLDSDAPQLSATSLDALSPEALEARAAQAAQEEQERREREEEREREKRKRRKERKEMKRLAAALATADGEFEGFQGSGSGLPEDTHRHIPSAFRMPDSPIGGSDTGSSAYSPRIAHPPDYAQGRDDADDADADLDGAMYSSRPKLRGSSADGSSGSGSRSRTSASVSQHSYSNLPRSPLANDVTSAFPQEKTKRKRKQGTKSPKSSSSRSTGTTASSDPTQPASPPNFRLPTSAVVDDFDGTPGGLDSRAMHDFHSPAIAPEECGVVSGMPSPGLSGPRGKRGLSVSSAGALFNNSRGGF